MSERHRVLLDTSVVIAPPAAGLASLAELVAVSAITVAELEYGIGAASDPVERQRRRRRLQVVLAAMNVMPFDSAIAESYGMLANLVRAAGRNPRPRRLDLLIAATAGTSRTCPRHAERRGLPPPGKGPRRAGSGVTIVSLGGAGLAGSAIGFIWPPGCSPRPGWPPWRRCCPRSGGSSRGCWPRCYRTGADTSSSAKDEWARRSTPPWCAAGSCWSR